LDKRGSELLFQVISKRYELGSIIITTNIASKDWPLNKLPSPGVTRAHQSLAQQTRSLSSE
jgi:hypothetical protein